MKYGCRTEQAYLLVVTLLIRLILGKNDFLKGCFERDEGVAILYGFVYWIPNHWDLSFNCVFSKFSIDSDDSVSCMLKKNWVCLKIHVKTTEL